MDLTKKGETGAGYANLPGEKKGSRGRRDARRNDPARTVQN